MLQNKKEHPVEKTKLHPRNKHRERYNFKQLIESCEELAPFVLLNNYNDESIDFFNPQAVKMLNKALLKHFYGIANWDIPQNYLCPPIPGRADYIHNIADLLKNEKGASKQKQINCLDIGVGANCVYPIIGNKEYGWTFVGSDIDLVAVTAAKKIIELNPPLNLAVEIRSQSNKKNVFQGIIKKDEHFDVSICNPPFHASLEEAEAGTLRKLSNLKGKKNNQPVLNFGGKSNELWCDGGEAKFVQTMILESKQFSTAVDWFTTLISKKENLQLVYETLYQVNATDVKTMEMGQGNKTSRVVAWTFINR
jgi:23S rRNA (adenine1618-N6)-methyltransferase